LRYQTLRFLSLNALQRLQGSWASGNLCPPHVSRVYGWQWPADTISPRNEALQSAAAVGVTVCVACDDNGSSDGVKDGKAHVDFPASSPYVLACGGTHLVGSGGSITDEKVWNDLPDNGATGGGVSYAFPLPSWQKAANVPASVNPGKTQRTRAARPGW